LEKWRELLHDLRNPEHEIAIALVGKYAQHRDAYKSVYEALDHAGIANRSSLPAMWSDWSARTPPSSTRIPSIP
jgi:CTP synthase (UTP-ammonia lyase)